jgi:hypothetical protein
LVRSTSISFNSVLIGLTTTTWAAIGAIGACAAAITALMAVLQNTWLQRAMLQPHLTGIVMLATQRAGLEIHNAGGGVAITPRFFWAHEDRFVEGELGGGLGAGEYRDILADDLNRDTLADSHGVHLQRRTSQLVCVVSRWSWLMFG